MKSYGIEHAGGGLDHARVVVALAAVECGAFDHKSSQSAQVDEICKLFAVAESAGSGEHGIFKPQGAYVDV